MRIAIMQPYFMPYIGYFQLIKASERFILFDDVQFIRHGWIARNRVLKPDAGWQYVIIPLQAHNQNTLIKNIFITEKVEWKNKLLRQLEHYKKKAPFYKNTIDLLRCCFEYNNLSIVEFNGNCLKVICDYLDIPFKVEISSKMNFDYSNVNDAGEWALRISEQLGANSYLNPSGGVELFDPVKFSSKGIELNFLETNLLEYSQRRPCFESALSIIDVLMFNSKDEINRYLDFFSLK